ncbi:MAG: hypothetical protein ACR2O6_14570 [Ilumatobacteraceae bacterium]
MTDGFVGAWLVTEYVHDPDGTFAGVVHQRRLLRMLESGAVRVTQVCEPDAALAGHPMDAFRGEWEFDLVADGAARRYLGPDVVGYGTEWSPGAMTGRGIWPRFGYAFESYGVLVAPDRQLTGGFFSLAGRSVADIVGVAVPEADGTDYATLALDATPPDVAVEADSIGRQVGPMQVTESWPSPTERVRTWALTDSDGTEVVIAEHSDSSGPPHATVTITPPP